MIKLLINLCLFALATSKLSAASAVLRIVGAVETATTNSPFPVGSQFVFQASWVLPSFEDLPRNLMGPAFQNVLGTATTDIGGLSLASGGVSVSTYQFPAGTAEDYFAQFNLDEVFGPGQPALRWSRIKFVSNTNFFNDVTQLPGSLDDWNLMIPAFEFIYNDYSAAPWVITSNHYTSLTLTTIPEPTSSGFVICAALVCWVRRGILRN